MESEATDRAGGNTSASPAPTGTIEPAGTEGLGAGAAGADVIVVGASDGLGRVTVLVDALLAELRSLSLESAGRGVLRGLVVALGRARAGADAAEARAVTALEALGDGGVDAVEVIRRNVGASQREARRRQRRAEALAEMPNVADALAGGDISTEHAEALARAASATSPEAVDGDAELLAQVAGVPADRAGRAIETWTQRNRDPVDLHAQHLRQRRRRRLHFGDGDDGMLMAHAAFDRVLGAQFRSLINGIADRIWRAEGGRDNPNSRSPEQRRLDALAIAVGLEPEPPAGVEAARSAGASGRPAGSAATPGRLAGSAATPGRPAGSAGASGRPAGSAGTPGLLAGGDAAGGHPPEAGAAGRATAAGAHTGTGSGQTGRAPRVKRTAGAARAVLNGSALDGSALDGSATNGSALDRPATNGSERHGRPATNGSERHGSPLDGSTLNGSARNGSAAGGASGDDCDPAKGGGPAASRRNGGRDGLPVSRRHQVVIVASADVVSGADPQGLCEIPGVGPIPQSELERLACDAELFGLLFSGNGEPLWHGRGERTATDAQWRALLARDGVCVLCADEPSRCEAHHVVPWAKPGEGPTDIDNLALLCGTCHRRLHNNRRILTRDPDGTWGTTPDPRFTGRSVRAPKAGSVQDGNGSASRKHRSACRTTALESTARVEDLLDPPDVRPRIVRPLIVRPLRGERLDGRQPDIARVDNRPRRIRPGEGRPPDGGPLDRWTAGQRTARPQTAPDQTL